MEATCNKNKTRIFAAEMENIKCVNVRLCECVSYNKCYNKCYSKYYHTALADKQNGLSKELSDDGCHPKPDTYYIMEKLVLEMIEN